MTTGRLKFFNLKLNGLDVTVDALIDRVRFASRDRPAEGGSAEIKSVWLNDKNILDCLNKQTIERLTSEVEEMNDNE